jgi:hypothetical protein
VPLAARLLRFLRGVRRIFYENKGSVDFEEDVRTYTVSEVLLDIFKVSFVIACF